MLDLMTCIFLSIATISSLLVMVIGSSYRLRKLKSPQIILPKSESLQHCQPFRAHRAFQMRRISAVDLVGIKTLPEFQICQEQNQELPSNPNILQLPRETAI
jgi:hypothetical protein